MGKWWEIEKRIRRLKKMEVKRFKDEDVEKEYKNGKENIEEKEKK